MYTLICLKDLMNWKSVANWFDKKEFCVIIMCPIIGEDDVNRKRVIY